MARPIVTLGVALLLATAEAGQSEEAPISTGLPPVECVKWLREARLAHFEGDEAAELDRLRHAFEAFPDEVAPIYALLVYGDEHGLPEEERRRLEERLHQRLADPERALPLSLLHRIARDPTADEELLGRLADSVAPRLELPPEVSDDLLALVAELQRRLGQGPEAAATLERLWRRTGDPQIAWSLLWLRLELERWDEALELMESVEELEERFWTLHLRLLAKVGHLDRALALLERHAATAEEGLGIPGPEAPYGTGSPERPALAVWLEHLAWSFRDAGRDAEAEALFRRALALEPDDPGLQATLLHLYSTAEERQVHSAAVARSWKEETDPQALLDEGTQRLAAGDAEAALGLLERAAPHFPHLEAPWFNLGMAAYRLERWDRVVEALNRAVELNPERAPAFLIRGVALMHLERCGEAVEALESALDLDPERPESHYYLFHCYRTLGKPEAAERHRKLYEASSNPG